MQNECVEKSKLLPEYNHIKYVYLVKISNIFRKCLQNILKEATFRIGL